LGATPLNVPLAGCVTTVNVSGSESGSVPVSVIGSAVSSAVETDCAVAVGASLPGFTVMEIVAAALVSVASLAVNVKLSAPLKLRSGVYVRFGATPLNVPFAGCVTTVNVSGSDSGSVPVSVIGNAVSSAVETDCAVAVGASLPGFTVMEIVAAELVRDASLAVNVKLSAPLKFASGV